MPKTFFLEILTPEKMFLSGQAEAITVTTTDGEFTILAGHIPITMPLGVGSVRIKQDGEWHEAFQSEGFIEFDDNEAHVFLQACEWPRDIDEQRAEQAERRIRERMRQQRSMVEYQWNKAALARAMERLRITNRRGMR